MDPGVYDGSECMMEVRAGLDFFCMLTKKSLLFSKGRVGSPGKVKIGLTGKKWCALLKTPHCTQLMIMECCGGLN